MPACSQASMWGAISFAAKSKARVAEDQVVVVVVDASHGREG